MHTSDLDAETFGALRAMLDAAFDGELTEHDWEHCLGGMHALLWEDGEMVGHASVVQRMLLHRGRALRTGYVEAVAVRADRRRHGYGRALMAEADRVVRGAYEIGALAATDEALSFYAACGWQLWRGPTSALTPEGLARTAAADGCVFVLPVSVQVDLAGELTCDWRAGDVW
jgi:aminoglycoside 2'-N-acetyltransferase I